MTKDTLRETLTSIRNAILIKKPRVEIPATRITKALSRILYEEGLIEKILRPYPSLKKKSQLFLSLKYCGNKCRSVITDLQIVSRPGLRFYAKYEEIPRVFGGMGLVVLSTSQGLMTDREARLRKLGGEVLCSIWLLNSS